MLLVDDRPDKLLAMEAVLESLHVELFKARSGPEALALCEHNEFVVILLDVRMPGMNGFEAATRIRQIPRSSRTPIIFVSAAETPELIEQGYALGAVDYIQTLVPQVLRTKVSVFVDLYRQRMEISAHQAVEAGLRREKEEAENASAAKDRFIAALSHELRTPLTPVVALLPTLLECKDISEKVREDLQMIYQSVQLETQLINDLLDLTSITKGRFPLNLQQVDLHMLVRNVLELMRGDANGKDIRFHIDLAAENSFVWADPVRIQQVLWHLTKNALRYTPSGGDVFIRTRTSDAGYVVLEVADTGIGFSSEELARIFEPFERPAAEQGFQFGGLGLGLFISRNIIEQHGGTLTAESRGENQGALFRLQLKAAERASVAGPLPRLGHVMAARPLRLLLVEDDENTREVMARLLQKRGHDVSAAENVREAMNLAASNAFDIIISDLGLPDGSGLELMPQLKDRYGLRGIAISGYGMEEDLRKSRSAGFEIHLTKPVDFQMLEAAVRQVSNGNS